MTSMRVSRTMKRAGLVAVVVAIAVAVWVAQRPSGATPTASTTGSASSPPAGLLATPAKPAPVAKVTKLATAEERRALADRITSAQAARAATHAPARPRLPEGSADDSATPISKTEIRAAMREVIPHLTACYEAALPTLPSPQFKMTAELTLRGDPDVGTIVDARALADSAGTALPAALDDCFRSTFMLMALPPLAEGDTLEVRYPFEFRSE